MLKHGRSLILPWFCSRFVLYNYSPYILQSAYFNIIHSSYILPSAYVHSFILWSMVVVWYLGLDPNLSYTQVIRSWNAIAYTCIHILITLDMCVWRREVLFIVFYILPEFVSRIIKQFFGNCPIIYYSIKCRSHIRCAALFSHAGCN